MIKSCDSLHALDSCLCLVVFFPSMLFYWRGIWDLFGVYIFPNDAPKCHWVTAGLGACSIVGYYALPLLSRLLGGGAGGPPSRRPVYIIVTRLYMYAFAVLAMAYWRGVWSLADYYLLQFGWKSGLIGLVVCHTILLVLRSSRTLIFPPFAVALDTTNDLLVPSTNLQTQVNWSQPKSIVKYTLDSLLTKYVIVTTTILTWRSSLSLLDVFMFPNDALLSNWSCFVIGLAASVLLFALEVPFTQLANHIRRTQTSRRWLRLVYEDAVYILVFVAESFLWRGGWNLNTTFVIADPMVGGWVNHAIGTVLLFSLQLFSYVSFCGCVRDGQDIDSDAEVDGIYATKYIRVLDKYLQEGKEGKKTRASVEENRKQKHKKEDDDDDDDDDEVVGGNSKVTEKEKESLVNEKDADFQLTKLSSSSSSSSPAAERAAATAATATAAAAAADSALTVVVVPTSSNAADQSSPRILL